MRLDVRSRRGSGFRTILTWLMTGFWSGTVNSVHLSWYTSPVVYPSGATGRHPTKGKFTRVVHEAGIGDEVGLALFLSHIGVGAGRY